MTTISDLETRAAEIEAAMMPHRLKARTMIRRRIEDAGGHAAKGFSQALRDAPDGRATIARVRRSRAYGAALARLTELADGLVRIVSKYRDGAYVSAHAFAVATLPGDILRTGDPKPRATDRAAARGMALHGVPLVTEVKGATKAAAASLKAILGRASRAMSDDDANDLLDAWEEKTISNLEKVADRLLSDSAVALEKRAMIDAAKPGLFHFDPTIGK